ncbi:hypothetical protein N7G274_001453 [Stereocaulon virgatum]|uniref:CFEM domain-containing protein n=1 Tax=Stereocaulon virgatum TaxID=373712 RepID=A0ABR4AMG1_9LECA
MKLVFQTSVLALAALCTAQLQTLSDLPACAKPCASTLPNQCNLGVSCICSDQAFITGISCCVATACSPSDQQKTLQVAQQLCDTVNVKLPQAASCSGSTSAAASGASTASSATSATSAMAATGSSSMSSRSMMASSVTSAATAGSATGSSRSSTASNTSSTAATAASGAAQNFGSNMRAVGAAVAALALL